jgi:hypothetical protein
MHFPYGRFSEYYLLDPRNQSMEDAIFWQLKPYINSYMFRSNVLTQSSDRKIDQENIEKSVLLQKDYVKEICEIRGSHGGECDVTPCTLVPAFQRNVLLPSVPFILNIETADSSEMLVTFYQNSL